MKKAVSIVLSVLIVFSVFANLSFLSTTAQISQISFAQLSTKLEDYILHADGDKASEQDSALFIDEPGYIANYQLKDVSVKDIDLRFKVKFEDITANHANWFFEVSVRNQMPEKYLWQKWDSFSLQFIVNQVGDKKYVKSAFKKNTSPADLDPDKNGSDDGGWGHCDTLIEIIDGDVAETDIRMVVTTENGNTRFRLYADGEQRVDIVKNGYDLPAGAVTINTDNCKTWIMEPTPEPLQKVNLSTAKNDWVLIKETDKMVEQGDALVINKPGYFSNYQLKDVYAKDVEVNFRLKFEDIAADHNGFLFDISVRNQDVSKYLFEKPHSYSLQMETHQKDGKKYVKSFFKTNNGGSDDGGFGFYDYLFEVIDGETDEKFITISITTVDGNTTFKLFVDGELKINQTKNGNDKPMGAITINTKNCTTKLYPVDGIKKIELSTKASDYIKHKEPNAMVEQGDSLVINNGSFYSVYELRNSYSRDVDISFNIKFDGVESGPNIPVFEIAVRNQVPSAYLYDKPHSYSLQMVTHESGGKTYIKAFFKTNNGGSDCGGFGFYDYLFEVVDGETVEKNIRISVVSDNGKTTFRLIADGAEVIKSVKDGVKPAGVITFNTRKCRTIINPAPPEFDTDLSTNASSYIRHTEADKIVEQDGALVINKPGYYSVYELKNSYSKDVNISFNLKFDQVNSGSVDLLEIAFRNQDPSAYLWSKPSSYSLKLATHEKDGKQYVKAFFKTNNGGSDDGGFGFYDYLFEVVDGSTEAKDITISITSTDGNTTFKLIADGEVKIDAIRNNNDKPAGVISINTNNCKTTIRRPVKKKYVLNLSSATPAIYAYHASVRAIQGIVNRYDPVLFITTSNPYYKDADSDWIDYFESKGYEFVEINNYRELLEKFKYSFEGIITMNDAIKSHNDWTAPLPEVAGVIGGLTDYVPVPVNEVGIARLETDLYQRSTVTLQKQGAPKKYITSQLETLDFTNRFSIYQWEFDHLKDYTSSAEIMGLTSEGLDYAVSQKMMYFDLQPSKSSADGTLFNAVLDYLDSNNVTFTYWGWVDIEDKRVAAISSKGGNLKCIGSSNLSFFASIPTENTSWTQSTGINLDNVTYQNDKYYVTFIASESDTVKAPATFQHGAWQDAARGQVPINWGMSADLVNYFPFFFDYYKENATNKDYFYSGGGLLNGFVDPLKIPNDSMQEYIHKSRILAAKTDQKFVDYYNDWSGEWSKLLGSQANYDKYMQYLDGSGMLGLFGGFTNKTSNLPEGAQPIPSGKRMTVNKWTYNSKDFLSVSRPYMYPVRTNTNKQMWEEIVDYILLNTDYAEGTSVSNRFTVGYYGYIFTGDFSKNQFGKEPGRNQVMAVSPTMLKQVMDYLNTHYPNKFIFTTMDEFSAAAMKALNIQDVRHTIIATAGENGTISPSGEVEVTSGGSQEFTITPNEGYEIDKVLVDGEEATLTDGKYTFTNVTSNHTISVTFKPVEQQEVKYTITATAGDNGSISPSGEVEVTSGGSQEFTITPDEGYEVDKVLVDGEEATLTNGKYTFTNVTSNHTISVSFKKTTTIVEDNTITDEDSGIAVNAPSDILPEDTELLIEILTEGEKFDLANNVLKGTAKKFKLFNISLMLDGEDFQPTDYLTFRIPVPSDYDKSNIKVYGISESGEKTLYQSVYKVGYLEFKAMGSGMFALVEVSSSKGPATGEQNILLYVFILGMTLSASLLGLVLYKKRKACKA